MAPDTQIAKLLADIASCHSADLPGERLLFFAGMQHIGYVKPDFAEQLCALEPSMTRSTDKLIMPDVLLPHLNRLAASAGVPVRREDFDVRATPDGKVLGVLDRGALPSFGVLGQGVHMNGLVRKPDGVQLWVARRAANKKLDPGKLDHLVAGGIPAGYGPFETLLKEAAEEAGLDETLTSQAREVAQFRYDMDRSEGLRRDKIYVYDLELPEGFQPHAVDGEVESFELWPLAQVRDALLTTDSFKFNVILVLTDLLIRYGLFTPAQAADLQSALRPS